MWFWKFGLKQVLYNSWARNGFYIFKELIFKKKRKKENEKEEYATETVCDLQSLK